MEWEVKNEIDYSPKGDDIDTFSLKVKAEIEIIYKLLNKLRGLESTTGLNSKDTTAYQLKVDKVNRKLLMRDENNSEWIELGRIGEAYFGIKPEDISAVRNTGAIGTIYGGKEENKPAKAKTNDLYYVFDEKRLYYWSGTSWELFLSLNFEDFTEYKNYCIARDEVAYNGKDKVLRLDKVTGKANVDITGSPDKLLGYEIKISNLKDGEVLAFNGTEQKIINVAKDEIKKTDVSNTGEANKIVKTDNEGVAHVSISGSAAEIDGIKVSTRGVKNGQVLAYESSTNSYKPVDKDYITEDNISTNGEVGKLVKLDASQTIHASLDGSASEIDGIKVETKDITDGQALSYDGKNKKLVATDKDYITEADISTTGEVNKLVKLDSTKTIHADIDGSAKKINEITIEAKDLINNELIAYDAKNKKLVSTTEKYITAEEVSEIGEVGKLIKLNKDKKINADISGSAKSIDGVEVDISGIKNGNLLEYDAANNKFKALENDFVRKSDISDDKDKANKLVALNENGKADIDITGSAAKIDGVKVSTAGMADGEVLSYSAEKNALVPTKKDYITEEDITETGEIGKLLRIPKNKRVTIDIDGSANALDNINVVAANCDDGDVLVYRALTNSFVPEPKGATTGSGKYLVIKRGSNILIEYNGSNRVEYDVSSIVDNVEEAKKWSTTRKITVTGMAKGEVEIDGSKDATLKLYDVNSVLADVAHKAEKADKLTNERTIKLDGLIKSEAVTFDGTSDVTLVVTEISGVSAVSNESAAKLATGRRIEITGDGTGEVVFDGSKDVVINLKVTRADLSAMSAQAVKATQDNDGNTITETYAKKSEISNTNNFVTMTQLIEILNGYLKKNEVSTEVTVADLSEYAKKTEIEQEYLKREDLLKALQNTIMSSEPTAIVVASAEKLTTPMKVEMTGAMEGAATLDGSGDIQLKVEVPESQIMTAAEIEALF